MDDLIVLNPDASQLTINLFSPDPTFVTDTYSTILSASSPSVFLSKTESLLQHMHDGSCLCACLAIAAPRGHCCCGRTAGDHWPGQDSGRLLVMAGDAARAA